jgi:hypothetical protein
MKTLAELKATVRANIARQFSCGDKVCDRADPRHEGTIVAINTQIIATVRWENGWRSDIPTEQLRRNR